jgi:hypothetical protein
MAVAGGTIALGVVSPWFRKLLGTEPLSPVNLTRSLVHGIWPILLLEMIKLRRHV